MFTIDIRPDKLSEEMLDYSRKLGQGMENLMNAGNIDTGVTPREAVYREDIPAGGASPILCEYMAVDFSQSDDPAELQAAYARKRPPLRPDVWLAGADFRWTHRDTATRRTEFNLSLEDTEGFEIVTPEYHHETEIVV